MAGRSRRFTVELDPVADREIAAAFAYIHERSPANAAKWLQGLDEKIDSLEMMPRRFAYAREYDGEPTELRQFVFKSYRVIFTIEDRTVRVLHVRHVRRQSLER